MYSKTHTQTHTHSHTSEWAGETEGDENCVCVYGLLLSTLQLPLCKRWHFTENLESITERCLEIRTFNPFFPMCGLRHFTFVFILACFWHFQLMSWMQNSWVKFLITVLFGLDLQLMNIPDRTAFGYFNYIQTYVSAGVIFFAIGIICQIFYSCLSTRV